jgi:hypothetical protein
MNNGNNYIYGANDSLQSNTVAGSGNALYSGGSPITNTVTSWTEANDAA